MSSIDAINEELSRAFGGNIRGLEMPSELRTTRSIPPLSSAARSYLKARK